MIDTVTEDSDEKILEIPAPKNNPVENDSKPDISTMTHIYFDIEATGLGRTSHITQISARRGLETFSKYILPFQSTGPQNFIDVFCFLCCLVDAFAVVGTLNFLRIIVALIPYATRILGEARVSFARLKRLLVQEEFEQHSDKCMNKDNSVELDNAFFMWEDASILEMGAKPAMEANNKAKNRKGTTLSFFSFI
ncbi:unnamed protein product [Mytilus coruscus]|uniref:Exonuclease domain-containing protein n=1 Tax=Mytilus coruscus TaxID=42192 RepID=A0A6J8B5P5_MYTCO|nr:unnamed protein product [Mytilus coruscus]